MRWRRERWNEDNMTKLEERQGKGGGEGREGREAVWRRHKEKEARRRWKVEQRQDGARMSRRDREQDQ
ncbi:hypothetical protein I302_103340 [Kwoniella bestiolae CBS 10118]|uniref:Uncharacterized protein n=1 Tax=Kwoniella bestiolae CBS 10118 TaxID=1296100 RepID=A0AAJ8K566_9TREE